jgi:uncharacterized protein (DUF1800 family)
MAGLRKACIAVTVTALWAAAPAVAPPKASAIAFPTDEDAVVHVLNRLAFGPRPGDVERVRAMGLQRYIDQQLHAERIPDAAMTARLAGLTTIGLSSREIAVEYEMPLIEARRMRKQAVQAPDQPPMPDPLEQKANTVVLELAEQKVLRAVYSDRQLQEVLTDFWFNHFNVDARKGVDRFLLTEYERDAIRPHVLGRFRDLLEATAKSPAMLFYLDNWLSADPNGPHPLSALPQRRRGAFRPPFSPPPQIAGRPMPAGKNNARGLNENYGRELMELHTLGVDGGYTQKDVTEVARCFTGWTIEQPRQGRGFKFDARFHDDGAKVVLGHRIKPGGGERDGEQVLDILAKHPATARFIATKLVRRFVSDVPPPELVDRVAKRFRSTDGDLREVMRTILTSPEFLSARSYNTKVKTPFEFVVSAVRATGADVQQALPLVRTLQQFGMPLFQCQPPTGYKDTADAWVNTGALVSRMNFSVALASNRIPGVAIAGIDSRLVSGPQQSPETASADAARLTSVAVRGTVPSDGPTVQTLALRLGGPEFQRR